MRGINDYDAALASRTSPANRGSGPPGPANFPVTGPPTSATDLLQQLVNQNAARQPHLRAADVTSVGQTLDWSSLGLMDRILIRNKGGSSVWIAFDTEGQNVDAFTSDLSYELQAQESICIPGCQFYKIGCRCAALGTGTVHAVAFLAAAGELHGSIS